MLMMREARLAVLYKPLINLTRSAFIQGIQTRGEMPQSIRRKGWLEAVICHIVIALYLLLRQLPAIRRHSL
jgi:hypothetical protein